MDFRDANPWNGASGPQHDVVMSCRVRLARNVAGFPFVNRAAARECEQILQLTRRVLVGDVLGRDMMWVDLDHASPLDRALLVERHLISKNHAESEVRRAVAISSDETLSIMVNEEDHLRMQCIAPGLQLDEVFRASCEVDDAIEARVDYAFSPRWGYLTACPTNVGTGIRFSVMLHLPALKITHEIERVRRAAKDLHLAVRGYYGEGSDSAGDFYQISNQVTLGRTEEDLLMEFQNSVLPRIIEYEQEARRILADRHPTVLDDRIHRALGLLRSARLLGTDEAMKLLSRVRLGVCLGRLSGIDLATVNRLFLQIQPAHLQLHSGSAMGTEQLREAKAALVRNALT
jgi:protein arginine kinase